MGLIVYLFIYGVMLAKIQLVIPENGNAAIT